MQCRHIPLLPRKLGNATQRNARLDVIRDERSTFYVKLTVLANKALMFERIIFVQYGW